MKWRGAWLLGLFLLVGPAAAQSRDPVAAVVRANAGLSAADREAKFDKMGASAFGFFRGTNHLFREDMAGDPRLGTFGGRADTRTWIQGDLHAANFGSLNDDRGRVVFDLNDFDEALIDDYQLDLWRMATSVALVARENGLGAGDEDAALEAFARGYLEALASFRGDDSELGYQHDRSAARGRIRDLLEDVERGRTRERLLEKWTRVGAGGRELDLALAELEAAPGAVAAELAAAWPAYGGTLSGGLPWDPGYFRIKSVARRLAAGTGSLGTPRYYVLIEGATADDEDDVLLDVKRQGPPAGLAHLSPGRRAAHRAAFAHDAERVVRGRRALSTRVDDHLGWVSLGDGHYTVSERTPGRDDLDLSELDSRSRLTAAAEQWAWILAAAHARADRDHDPALVRSSFERAALRRVRGRRGQFARLVRDVARGYADLVAQDHAAFVAARASSRGIAGHLGPGD